MLKCFKLVGEKLKAFLEWKFVLNNEPISLEYRLNCELSYDYPRLVSN